MKHKRKLRLLSVALALALAMACVPMSALSEGGFYAYVSSAQMAVYRDSSLTQYWGSLPQNTIVLVNDYDGEVAEITYRSRTGYAFIYDMKIVPTNSTVETIEMIETIEAVPVQSAAGAAVTIRQTLVYQKPDLKGKHVTVPAGLVVNVQDVNGTCAQVERDGCIGYMDIAHLAAQEAAPQEIRPEETLQTAAQAAISTQQTRVYQKPSLKSRYLTVPAGLVVNVQGVNGACAQVEYEGYIGFMYIGHLAMYEAAPQVIAQSEPIVRKQEESSGKITTLEQAAESGQYTNEQLLYAFATKVMGYNSAAACGLLGNCYYESKFSTTDLSDGNTSYGLFQWHASRWTRLKNFCEKYGYDSSSVVGQLYFLQYELKEYYPKVDKYLRAVSNDAQGAYDAAYYVCTVYLVPANKESQGEKRGNRAKTTYWEKYNGTAL